jgi:hypothetical protein
MTHKKLIQFTALLSLTALMAACGSSIPSNAQPQSGIGVSIEPAEVTTLKAAIVNTAKSFQGKCDADDNLPEFRKKLDPLINRLVEITPKQTEAQKLPRVAGGWQQVWADQVGGAPGTCVSGSDIYQVVFREGYYWNISKNITASGQSLGLLRGTYQVLPDLLRIEFTDLAFSPKYPPVGTDLVKLATRAEQREFTAFPKVFPVGLKGDLANVYVDRSIRIVRGKSDADANTTSLFILVKATSIR